MLRGMGLGEAGLGEARWGEAGECRLGRRTGCGGLGGNGGGTVGARRLLPTRRRGRAWGVAGLPEPGGRDGAGGEERVLEAWGRGMLGRAGAGRLAVEEGKGWLDVQPPVANPPSSMPPQDLFICYSFCQEQFPCLASHHPGPCPCPLPLPVMPLARPMLTVAFSLQNLVLSSVFVLFDSPARM